MIDTTRIRVCGGNGGSGVVSFLTAPFTPTGGPDGGDGGKGGSVFIIGDDSTKDLNYFKSKSVFKAQHGARGASNRSVGKNGKNIFIKVPFNCAIYEIVGDIKNIIGYVHKDMHALKIANGGIGGLGNRRFLTSKNRSPLLAQSGGYGEDKTIIVEMLIFSEAFIVGYPNAGKSQLVNSITNANVPVAAYPFTTTAISVKTFTDQISSFVLVDTPAIISGSCLGKGLGISFLRHALYTNLIVYVLDITEQPIEVFRELLNEISHYNNALFLKPSLLLISKIDKVKLNLHIDSIKSSLTSIAESTFTNFLGMMLVSLKDRNFTNKFMSIVKSVDKGIKIKLDAIMLENPPIVKARYEHNQQEENLVKIVDNSTYEITHQRSVKIANASNLYDWNALLQFRLLLDNSGIVKSLYNAGISKGDTVIVGGFEFTWQ